MTVSSDVKMNRNFVLFVIAYEIVGALKILFGIFFFSITKPRLQWYQMSGNTNSLALPAVLLRNSEKQM